MIQYLAKSFFPIVILVTAAGATGAQSFPSGSAQARVIRFQLAVYYPARPTSEPLATLRSLAASDWKKLTIVTGELPQAPSGMVANARLENDVKKNYSPPSLAALKHFGRGLSAAQMTALQGSQQALIINFTHPQVHAFEALRNAYALTEQLARNTDGLLWDEESREVFTPDSWHERRLAKWTGGVPNVATNTAIHTYKNGELLRAISLGMAKFGLPDIVVDQFTWSHSNAMVALINITGQALAEGAPVGDGGKIDINLMKIGNKEVRDNALDGLLLGAQKMGELTLLKGEPDEGDPPNRLAAISFMRYPGPDVQARQDALITALFGSKDSVKYISHNDELEQASERARTKLAAMAAHFGRGLPVGEYVQVKSPFPTSKGGNEWMWVEVSKWHGNDLEGVLKNDPFDVPTLRSGQKVKVRLDQVFDYLHTFPDGRQEGNTTGRIIERMQGTTKH